MRYIIIFLALTCFFNLSAQQIAFFEKDQLNSSWKKSVSHFQESKQSYFGVYTLWQGISQSNGVVTYDKYGIKKGEFGLVLDYSNTEIIDAQFLQDNSLLLYGIGEKNWGGWSAYTYLYDKNGQVAWSYRDSIYLNQLNIINDSVGLGVLSVLKNYKTIKPATYLAWVNLKNGDIKKSIRDSTILQGQMQINTDSFYLKEVEYNDGIIAINGSNKSTGQYFVKLLDSSGTLISQSRVKFSSSGVFYTAMDNYFTSKANSDKYGKYQTIERYGNNHELLFKYSLDTSLYSNIEGLVVTKNNETVILNTPYDSNYNRTESELVWLNEIGQLKRKCNYKFDEGTFVMNSLISTEDEGFLMKVHLHSLAPFGSGMLKIDSVGMVKANGVLATCKDFGVGVIEIPVYNQLSIIPNPAQNKVNVLLSHVQKGTIEVVGINGAVHFTQPIEYKSNLLDISSLPPGVYFVRINAENNTITKKLVVAR